MVAALAVSSLAFAAAFATARAQALAVVRWEASAPRIKRWGGVVLAIVGSWFVALALAAEPVADLLG